jgi:hypothetical protein
MPDRQAAEELGVALATVSMRRRALGIAPFRPPRVIEWPAERIEVLGRVSDAELARQWGFSVATVRRKRWELGRASLHQGSRPTNLRGARVQYLLDRLGKATDLELAEELGLQHAAVAALRSRLGIAALHPVKHWSESEIELLGTLPDREVADRLERSRGAVAEKRRSLGIAVFMPSASPVDPSDLSATRR